jgi:hypothetical protein
MSLKIKILCSGVVLLLYSLVLAAQQIKYPPADKVTADFKKLLERPRISLNPAFETTKTDSVVIEHGFIYSEKNERVPVLIYKPVTGARLYPLSANMNKFGYFSLML